MFLLNIERLLSDIRGSRHLHLKKVYLFVGHPVHSTYNYNLPAANKLLKVREKEWKCKTCQKSFHSAWDLENHLVKRNCSEITNPDFSCQYCDKSYKEKHNLNKHIKSKHCSKENVICSICGKVFQQKQSLTRHLKFVH